MARNLTVLTKHLHSALYSTNWLYNIIFSVVSVCISPSLTHPQVRSCQDWKLHSPKLTCPWKWIGGILLSFWDGLFPGPMLVSRRVQVGSPVSQVQLWCKCALSKTQWHTKENFTAGESKSATTHQNKRSRVRALSSRALSGLGLWTVSLIFNYKSMNELRKESLQPKFAKPGKCVRQL